MTASKRANEQRTRRDNKRAEGYVLKQVWVRPEDWPAVQAFLKSQEANHETN